MASHQMRETSGIRGETLSLAIDPGKDLLDELGYFFKRRNIRLGAVFNALGMLDHVRLMQLGKDASLKLEGPVDLVNATGIIRRTNNDLSISLNVIVSKSGRLFAGKPCPGCVAAPPEGVTIFLSVIGKDYHL